jgi:spore coat polysaccharide biosynthesis protein SpsF
MTTDKQFPFSQMQVSREGFIPTMIITQARMMSTRLSGKVMKEVLGLPLLYYHVQRLRRVQNAESVVVATSQNPKDDVIFDFCQKEGVHAVRGSEEDVLSRYFAAASAFGVDVVVRVTSDCPLIDPKLIEKAIACFQQHYQELDYLSNTLQRTFPRGMCVEVFRFEALKRAFFEASLPYAREHVTPYILERKNQFRIANFSQSCDDSALRLTVDTPEDFELIKKILEDLYPRKPDFTLQDIMELLDKHPEWKHINAHIIQKRL